MRKKILLLILTGLVLAVPAFADDDLRCPKSGKIVHEGDNQYEVESKCGAPTAKSPITVTHRSGRGGETTIQGEEWTYDLGPNAFIQKLRFEGSTLVSITKGDYGVKTAERKRTP